MGVLLIGGIILLFVLVFQRNQESKEAKKQKNNCPSEEYVLPERGEIKSVSYEDNIMTVLLKTEENQEKQQKIYVVDLCKYEVKHKIRVKP